MRRLTGFHAIEEVLRSGKAAGARLLVAGSGPRIKRILEFADKAGLSVSRLRQEELDRLAPENRGCALEIAEAPTGEIDLDEYLAGAGAGDRGLVLVLDHIEDPQNLGAILRSADVFACDLVLAPKRRAAPLSETVARTSAGALAHVPLALVPNLAEALRRLEAAGFWRYAANMGGTSLPQTELPPKCAFIMGNEGSGVSRLLREACDGELSIPQAGHVDSLNVSAAAAIFLYEYRRRFPAQSYVQ